MMMPSKNKEGAAMIVASMEPQKADDAAPEMDAQSVAAEEVMSALASGDAESFKEALKSFVSMCMDSYDEEDAE